MEDINRFIGNVFKFFAGIIIGSIMTYAIMGNVYDKYIRNDQRYIIIRLKKVEQDTVDMAKVLESFEEFYGEAVRRAEVDAIVSIDICHTDVIRAIEFEAQ